MLKLNIDIDKLQKETASSIQAGKIEAEVAERKRKEREEHKRLMDELKAQGIVDQIPARCEQESRAGRNFALVMSFSSISDKDYEHPPGKYGICKPEWLRGTSRLVYDACVEAKLNPTIEYWHDGIGIKGGFNIVVHW